MWIVRLALRRPYTFIVLAVLIVLLGVFTHSAHADRHLSGTSTFRSSAPSGATSVCRPRTWPIASSPTPSATRRPPSTTSSTPSRSRCPACRWSSTSSSRTSTRSCRTRRSPACRRRCCGRRRRARRRRSSWPTTPRPCRSCSWRSTSTDVVGGAAVRPRQHDHPPGLATVQGASLPYPYGGKQRQVQVDIDPEALRVQGPVGGRRQQRHRRAEPDHSGRHREDRRHRIQHQAQLQPARGPKSSTTSRSAPSTAPWCSSATSPTCTTAPVPQTNLVRVDGPPRGTDVGAQDRQRLDAADHRGHQAAAAGHPDAAAGGFQRRGSPAISRCSCAPRSTA